MENGILDRTADPVDHRGEASLINRHSQSTPEMEGLYPDWGYSEVNPSSVGGRRFASVNIPRGALGKTKFFTG